MRATTQYVSRRQERGAHLLKVGAHEHDEVGQALCLLAQERRVLLCLVDVVDRARADNDDELVAVAAQDGRDLGARLCDGALRGVRDGDLGLEERGLDEGLDLGESRERVSRASWVLEMGERKRRTRRDARGRQRAATSARGRGEGFEAREGAREGVDAQQRCAGCRRTPRTSGSSCR